MSFGEENIKIFDSKYRKDRAFFYITFAIFIGIVVGLLTAVKLDIVLTVVGFVVLIFITYRWPSWPFFIIPWAIAIRVPLMNFGGSASYTITVLDALIALLGIEIVLVLLGFWPHIRGRDHHFSVQILVLAWFPLLTATVGGFITFGPDVLTRGFLIFTKRWAEYSLLPLAACLFLPKKSIKWVTSSIIAAGAITVLSAFTLKFNQALLSAVGAETYYGGESRATGLLFNPNVYGNFSVLIMNFLIGLLLIDRPRSIIVRWLLAFLLLAFLYGFLSSGSREALLGFVISLIFWSGYIIHRGEKWLFYKWISLMLYFIIIGGVLAQLTPPARIMLERGKEVLLEGLFTYNVAARIEAQSIGLIMFFDHPLGIGVGNIGLLGKVYLEKYGRGFLRELGGTDSMYVDTLIEGGIFGLFFLLLTLWLLYWRNRGLNNVWAVSLKTNILALLVAGFFAYTFYSPPLAAMIWLLASLSEVARSRA